MSRLIFPNNHFLGGNGNLYAIKLIAGLIDKIVFRIFKSGIAADLVHFHRNTHKLRRLLCQKRIQNLKLRLNCHPRCHRRPIRPHRRKMRHPVNHLHLHLNLDNI
jgi:hypothetical protein